MPIKSVLIKISEAFLVLKFIFHFHSQSFQITHLLYKISFSKIEYFSHKPLKKNSKINNHLHWILPRKNGKNDKYSKIYRKNCWLSWQKFIFVYETGFSKHFLVFEKTYIYLSYKSEQKLWTKYSLACYQLEGKINSLSKFFYISGRMIYSDHIWFYIWF